VKAKGLVQHTPIDNNELARLALERALTTFAKLSNVSASRVVRRLKRPLIEYVSMATLKGTGATDGPDFVLVNIPASELRTAWVDLQRWKALPLDQPVPNHALVAALMLPSELLPATTNKAALLPPAPPRPAEFLLLLFLPRGVQDDIAGDMSQRFIKIVTKFGRFWAACLYWGWVSDAIWNYRLQKVTRWGGLAWVTAHWQRVSGWIGDTLDHVKELIRHIRM
jgi:hypothetical protein